MAYIKQINIGENSYLIEPILYITPTLITNTVNYTANLDHFSLENGVVIHVQFTATNPASATLNVNSTGAKAIYYGDAPVVTGLFTAGRTYALVYDGVHWSVIGDLENTNIMAGTTSYWQSHNSFIAPAGTIIIYTDRGTYTNNGTTIAVPGIKIGDGLAYVTSLPFVGDDVAAVIRSELNDHINDNIRHITSTERTFWNNKLNCDVTDEILQLNRL